VGVDAAPIEYPDGSSTEFVEKQLFGTFGKGVLKRSSVGDLSETLEARAREIHITPQRF
jgi:glutathione synthase/RimK-type ligase-like ATP-grasp enzyme